MNDPFGFKISRHNLVEIIPSIVRPKSFYVNLELVPSQ